MLTPSGLTLRLPYSKKINLHYSHTKFNFTLLLPPDWPIRANAASLRAVTAMRVFDTAQELMPAHIPTTALLLFD